MASGRDRRLDRLLPGLSAQERAVFALRQFKSGNTETPAIDGAIPSHQVATLNRYIRLMNTVNCDLGAALLLIDAQVKQTDIKYGWLMSLVLFADEIEGALHHTLRDTTDKKVRLGMKRLIARSPGALEVPLDLMSDCNDSVTAGLVRALTVAIRDGLQTHWRELRAVELVVEDVAEEFDGEDPLRPDTRKVLEDAKAVCVSLCHDMQPYVHEFVLPEPTEDDVETVRRFVNAEADRH